MVAARAANLGKLNGRDKSLHKMSEGGRELQRRTRGILLAASGDPVFGGRDGEWGGEGNAGPSMALPLLAIEMELAAAAATKSLLRTLTQSRSLLRPPAPACVVELVSAPPSLSTPPASYDYDF